MVEESIIAIIPARGGSKRIPHKNIIDVAGKPMIVWTIEAALQSGLIDEVVVSTDDKLIAEIAQNHGATVPFLRSDFADENSPVSHATIQTLRQWVESGRNLPRTTVQLMANCPLRTNSDIDIALSEFIRNQWDFLISSFPYGWSNPWWAHKVDEDGVAHALFAEALQTRSQDLPKLFCPTGAIWIANTEQLIKHGSFYGPGYRFFEMNWENSIDIDDYDDLKMAEFYLKKRIELL
ncbi:MAG: acylneuraminate cytidylyltransferase family protein [Saprospiraceae bacterium]|nr:acylneuraminate cytidylyltransferase family protein [Saprospiraceae bacterium]